MLYANTPANTGLASNLFTIQGDEALAKFSGTTAMVSLNDPMSGVIYNGFTVPFPFLQDINFADSDVWKGFEDFFRKYTPYGWAYSAGEELRRQQDAASGEGEGWFDAKFWLVSIGLALLGLIFVLGGVLSFR